MSHYQKNYDDSISEDDENLRSRLVQRYAEFLDNHADEIVVIELQRAYEACIDEGDEYMVYCIRKVLQYYMSASEYDIWHLGA